jgi:hypothetical protein
MNKLGYQPLTVLMQSESSECGWAFAPGRPSPTVIALRLLIALCTVLPICVIGVGSFTAGGTKQSMLPRVSPKSHATPSPSTNSDDQAAAADPGTDRTDAIRIADKPRPVDQAPTPPLLPNPIAATPTQPEEAVPDTTSIKDAARTAGRIKLEKFRHRVERRRARLGELYQAHAVSAEAYKKGKKNTKPKSRAIERS